jgi:hypothetical protein
MEASAECHGTAADFKFGNLLKSKDDNLNVRNLRLFRVCIR